MARRRTSMGRQRIEIRRIESEKARYVCFSKRRAGLFKKASELAIMCGAEVAAVVFSPVGKAFSFSHPSVDAILDRFAPIEAGGGGGAEEDNWQLMELIRLYGELRAQMDVEKARKERAEASMAKELAAASPVAAWLEVNIRDLGEVELMAYAAALVGLQAAVAASANQVLQNAVNHRRAMAGTARARSSNIQFLTNYGAVGFDQFGAGSSNANYGEMEMQIQQKLHMMMAMPPPWFNAAGTEMQQQQGFGFPEPY